MTVGLDVHVDVDGGQRFNAQVRHQGPSADGETGDSWHGTRRTSRRMSSMTPELAGTVYQGFGLATKIAAAELGRLAIASGPPAMRTSAV
jgi:hypothetical protein